MVGLSVVDIKNFMAGILTGNLFDKFYSLSFHAVVGIVLASTIVIIPLEYNNILQFLAGILFGAAGFIIAYLSDKMDLKVKSEG